MSDDYINGETEDSGDGDGDFFGGDPSGPVKIESEGSRATLTLAALEHKTGISYVTLQRIAAQHGDRIPHTGTGRNRRYYPEAVQAFLDIKAERAAGRGRGPQQDTPQRQRQTKPKSRGNNPNRVRKPATKPATTSDKRTIYSPLTGRAIKTTPARPRSAPKKNVQTGRAFAEVSASRREREPITITAPPSTAAVSKLGNIQRARLSTLMEQLLDLNKRVAETEAEIASILS